MKSYKEFVTECVCHIYGINDKELFSFYNKMDKSYKINGALKQLPFDKSEVELELSKRGLI